MPTPCPRPNCSPADMLLTVTRDFMRCMAQPFDRGSVGSSLLSEAQVNALDAAGGTYPTQV